MPETIFLNHAVTDHYQLAYLAKRACTICKYYGAIRAPSPVNRVIKMPNIFNSSISLILNSVIATVFVFILSTYAHAGMAFKFESQVETQATNDGNSAPTIRNVKSYILLEEHYFHFKGEEETIYDFDKKVIYSINRAKRIYSEMSLFANVGFRDYELQNRKFLGGVLEHTGVEENPISLIFSEHELSVQAKESKSEVMRQERNGRIAFLGGGKLLLEVGGPVIEIPEKYRKEFVRFFRHRYGGHPSFIDHITTSTGIYTDITIWQKNIGEKKIHLHFDSVEETQPEDYSLDGLKLFTEADRRLLSLVESVEVGSETNRKKNEVAILQNAKRLIEKQDLIGAMLAYLEYTLVSGSQKLPWTEEDRKLLLNSNDVQEMLAATQNPTNREEAASKITAIESIRKKQRAGGHILKIFESNTRASIGDHLVARGLMMDALETNPYITGAWKDLGGFYFQDYEPYEAWICWDTGRRINPGHPLLNDINNFEKQLQTEHPGLF